MKSDFKALLHEYVCLIIEATCPSCGSENAYIGLNSVECTNHGCKNFSLKQFTDTENSKKPDLIHSGGKDSRSTGGSHKTLTYDEAWKQFPEAMQDWEEAGAHHEDDTFSVDENGALAVEPAFPQEPWLWDSVNKKWYQASNRED